MSSLPTPSSLPVDSEAHRLAIFTLQQLASKTKAIKSALEYGPVLRATLENPFEDLVPSVTNLLLASKLQNLTLSAGKANSALSKIVKAAKQASRLLETFSADYTEAVTAIDAHASSFGKPDIALLSGIQVFPSKRTTLLPLNLHGEDLSFEKDLCTGRALREESPANPGLAEQNTRKVGSKKTTGAAPRICVTPSTPTVDNWSPVAQLQPSHLQPVALAVSTSCVVVQQPFNILGAGAQTTGPASSDAHSKETGARPDSSCSRSKTAGKTCATKRRELDQEDLLRYRQGKVAAATTTTFGATAPAATAGPSRQLAADQDCATAAPSRQERTAAPVKTLKITKPTTAKPKARLDKAKRVRFEMYQDSPQISKVIPSKLVIHQDSPEAGPSQRLQSTGAIEQVVHEDSLEFGPRRTSKTIGPVKTDRNDDSLEFGPPPVVKKTTSTAGPSRQLGAAQDQAPSVPSRQARTAGPVTSLNVKKATTAKENVRVHKAKKAKTEKPAKPAKRRTHGQNFWDSFDAEALARPAKLVVYQDSPEPGPSRQVQTTGGVEDVDHEDSLEFGPPRTPPPRLRPTIALAAATPTQQAGDDATPRAATAAVAPVRHPLGVREVPEPEPEPEPETEELADEPSVSRVEPVRENRIPIIEAMRVKNSAGIYQIQVWTARAGSAPEPLPRMWKRVKLPPSYISSRIMR